MQYSSKKQGYFALFFLTFFALCVGVIELLHHNQLNLHRERLQVEAKEQLSMLRSNLEADLMADIYKASTLATLITLLPNHENRKLNMAANRILNKSNHITVIGIAENDVVSHIYPRRGNERVIGLDYRTVPAQWVQIQKAKDIQEIFIAGPVELVQGGRGLIVRVPVFRDPPINKDYWGVISAVIDFNGLLRETGVMDFSSHYPMTIRGYDSSGELGDIFFGEPKPSGKVYAKEQVHFPYGGWSLAVYSGADLDQQLPWYTLQLTRLVGYPIVLGLSIALIVIYRLYIVADNRALHDELTQLPNRRYFMQSYKHQFQIAKRYKKRYSFALVNIDLDRFKHINDTYGHDAGDKVLIACAERIRSSLRRSDIVARMGGDEFLVIVHNPKTEDSIHALVKKLRFALCSNPVIYEQDLIYLRTSIGYAMFDPEMTSPQQMMKIADERMYQQKHYGG
ncbi:diguanylate cyclase [Vibrio campbellii]|jgi:diguanylate cyclase (GGDEF)-like protein|uniref:Diguanylate cyclase n=1 Tax=Vibrio campbellii TaxID=680 RepID=A0ACC7R6V2_9VIBR|nr:diguanylate cyclase [Vibrio campbellii]AUV87858.1 sensor domain-containing diguanylate cyclase [Vibrio campbellii]